MTEAKTGQKIVTWAGAVVALALAVGWFADHRALETQLYSSRAANDKAKDIAKKAVLEKVAAEKELKLTKQALFDADETRGIIGQKLQECEAREFAALDKLEKAGKKP